MRRLIPAVLPPLLLLSGAALAQRATPGDGAANPPTRGETYRFLVGGDELRSLDPRLDPVIMSADNGDRLEIRGDGSFTIWPKDIRGSGTFVHKDAAGNEVRRGSWVATEFLSFLPFDGHCGRLELRVDLIPAGRVDAIPGRMRVECPLGQSLPNAEFEARVVFQDSGLNFNKPVQGGTLFIRLHFDPPLCSGLQGTCAHPLCRTGAPLDPACQPEIDPACVVRICGVDPYCCADWWDQSCVDRVRDICGLCCCTGGVATCG